MPRVLVERNPQLYPNRNLEYFVSILPGLVAETLSCNDPGGLLTRFDVGVSVRDYGPYDIHRHNVEITVWAHDFPSRRANLEERRTKLQREIQGVMPGGGLTCDVFVALAYTSWGKFRNDGGNPPG